MAVELPKVPVAHDQFITYLADNPNIPLRDLVKPYKEYESTLREVFAQHRSHPALEDPAVNAVPIFAGQEATLKTRARDPANDPNDEQYIMPLKAGDRRGNGSAATAQSLKEFRHNFNLFSEQSLTDMDWSNVVAAGSSVVTSMLPVPEKHRGSKRSLREYYHQKLAPSSDVDLFLVGLDEESAAKKIAQIEECIRNSVLAETTTIRTKNAITIASQYPTRHIQIVLRLYKSVSEILTGFDIDSSCFAYDGKQVWATPRGITSFCSQINEVDLTRRSPSYETRLAKYAHRGFEAFFPELDRSRIDPTLYERSFVRTLGLARLLLLERLPTESDREQYLNQRRIERGRPQLDFWARRANRHPLPGNKKDDDPEDIPDWEFDDAIANYHTFTVPYGPKYHAKRIERLLFTKDMLLNAEWNKNDDRKVNLHRHPCFLGDVKSIIHDCCGDCPKPTNDEEKRISEEESKIYVSGEISFLKDDPGRQQIGSFNPLTEHDWTDMAYLGNTQILCEAIIDGDINAVESWLAQEGNDVNHRDHSGRMPLHFAIYCGQLEIVKALVNAGARITSRIADGFTSLHMAAACGRADILKVIGEKSEANEEMEAEKEDKRKAAGHVTEDVEMVDVSKATSDDDDDSDKSVDDEDSEDYEHSGDEEDDDEMTQGSFVKVSNKEDQEKTLDDPFGPDFFDFNILAWDSPLSPVHVAILAGNIDCIETLVSLFGADPLLPVKFRSSPYDTNAGAILPLVLACKTAHPDGPTIIKKLIDLGSKPSLSDSSLLSALHGSVLLDSIEGMKTMMEHDRPSATSALNFCTLYNHYHSNPVASSPLTTAIRNGSEDMVHALLDAGASPTLSYEDFCQAFARANEQSHPKREADNDELRKKFAAVEQAIVLAANQSMPTVVKRLAETGADVNSLNSDGGQRVVHGSVYNKGRSVVDIVDNCIKDTETQLNSFQEQIRWPNTNRRFVVDGKLSSRTIQASGYRDSVQALDLEFAKCVRDKIIHAQEKGQTEAKERYEKSQNIEKKKELKTHLQDLQELRSWLVDNGAEPFEKLYPEHKGGHEHSSYNFDSKVYHDDEASYKFGLQWQDPGASKAKQDAYARLFDAVWAGDVETVKNLTLKPIENGTDEPLSPLPITTQDGFGNSTLSLAIGRKHKALVRVILDIAQAQYQPEDESGKKKTRRRYRIRREDDPSDDESDDETDPDAIPITSEVVNDDFTIEDVAKLNQTVGSKVPVDEFIGKSFSMALFMEKKLDPWSKITVWDHQRTVEVANSAIKGEWGYDGLFQFAYNNNDLELFRLLLNAAQESSSVRGGEKPKDWSQDHTVHYVLRMALRDGNTPFVEEIVTSLGAGLPLDNLAAQVEVPADRQEKPRYYQGLKMYGKYKEDWAKQASGDHTVETPKHVRFSPLLKEIAFPMKGSINLRSIEFWLSDTAFRLYETYGHHHKNDKRVALLTEDSSWDSVVVKWLELRRDLGLHLMVLKEDGEENLKIFRYLLGVFSDSLDKKSKSGYSPLWLAFARQNLGVAQLLIERGADQTTRDRLGNNILHALLTTNHPGNPVGMQNKDDAEYDQFEAMLGLVDKRLLADLFTERSSVRVTGVTPFALWILEGVLDERIYEILERFMPEDVYTMYDGSGQTPVHCLVMQGQHSLLKKIINRRPELLGLENGTGQTPFELAQTRFIQKTSSEGLPQMHQYSHSFHARRRRQHSGDRTQPQEESAYTVLRDLVRGNPQIKRKVISVNDAREVSRRLAERSNKINLPQNTYYRLRRQSGERYHEDEVDEQFRDGKPRRAESEQGDKKDESVVVIRLAE